METINCWVPPFMEIPFFWGVPWTYFTSPQPQDCPRPLSQASMRSALSPAHQGLFLTFDLGFIQSLTFINQVTRSRAMLWCFRGYSSSKFYGLCISWNQIEINWNQFEINWNQIETVEIKLKSNWNELKVNWNDDPTKYSVPLTSKFTSLKSPPHLFLGGYPPH